MRVQKHLAHFNIKKQTRNMGQSLLEVTKEPRQKVKTLYLLQVNAADVQNLALI